MHYDEYLLILYRSACEIPYEEFSQLIFNLTRAIVPFDSGRLMAVEVSPDAARARSAILHNEPVSSNLDWEQISRLDTVLQTVTAAPDATFRFNALHLYAAREKSIVLDYAKRYQHRNGAVIASLDPATGYWDGLSLFRAADGNPFSAHDGAVLTKLAPHFRQALTISRQAACGPASASRAVAIAHEDGNLNYCTQRFAAIVHRAYPFWRGGRLPSDLLDLVGTPGKHRLGRNLPIIVARRQGGLIYLSALESGALARLTQCELAVATLYSEGYSHKEVAQRLQVAPATVRNVIQHVYEKLGIGDKARLAQVLAREARG